MYNKLPRLKTQRLLLRGITLRDAEIFYALRTDMRVVQYSGLPLYHAYDQAVDYVSRIVRQCGEQKAYSWIITLKDGPPVGSVCLWNPSENMRRFDIGYELLPAFQNRGYMGEAVKAVLSYAFDEMFLEMVMADPRMDNTASVRLLERNGFTLLREITGESGHRHGVFQLDRDTYHKQLQQGKE